MTDDRKTEDGMVRGSGVLDLEAIRARAYDFFGLYHLHAGPCRCGSCNPVVHPDHPRHADMNEVRRDHNALLAEVERLRSLLSRATALRPYTADDAENRAFVADIEATYPEEER